MKEKNEAVLREKQGQDSVLSSLESLTPTVHEAQLYPTLASPWSCELSMDASSQFHMA